MINLGDNEKVIREVRKHWFIALTYTLSFLLSAAAPAILFFVLYRFNSFGFSFPEKMGDFRDLFHIGLFFYSIWVLCLWLFFAFRMTNFYLDVWYITDRRILDVEQKNVFNRNEAVLEYEEIQDITIDTRGFFPTLLSFGSIIAQTAGKRREFIIKNATNPEEVRQTIVAQNDKIKKEGAAVRVIADETQR